MADSIPSPATRSARRRIAPAVPAALGALLLLSCGRPVERPPRPPAELRVPLPRALRSMDPVEGIDVAASNVIRQIYEGLVEYDPATLDIIPRLARSWCASADGLTWTLDLQPGVRFTDDPCFPGGRGREAVAEDVRYSIERGLLISERESSPIDTPPLAGLAGFLAGNAEHVEGISTAPPHGIRFSLTRPDPGFLHFLAQARCRVVPREAVETYGEEFGRHAVGTGPFRLVAWESIAGILLVRNRGYWQQEPGAEPLPCLDALRFLPFWQEDEDRLFAEGKIDMIYSYVRGPGAPDTRHARSYFVPRLNTIYVRFDYRSRHPVVHDPRLRRALSFGLVRPSWTNCVVARGLFPPGLPGYDPALAGQRTDMEEAARLLARAGHPGGRGLPPLRLAWRDWDGGVGEAFAETLRRLGLRVDLTLYRDGDYLSAVRAGRADLFRDGWIADYPDPENFLQLFHSGSPANEGGYANPEYDRLFDQLRVESDPGRRISLARKMERLLVDDTAALFRHHEREMQFVSPRVRNWSPNCTNPLNICFYERVRVEPPAERRAP